MRKLGPEYVFAASHSSREFAVAERILNLPDVDPDIVLTPESRHDKRGDLTGLMFSTRSEYPTAYPGLVPDNGCGYCLALTRVPQDRERIDSFARDLIRRGGMFSPERRRLQTENLLQIMLTGPQDAQGRGYTDLKNEAADSAFCRELAADPELEILLKQPFGCFLGHFLELRRITESARFQDGDCVLILHAGSQGMHRLLNNKLHERYGYHSRVYGAPLDTKEGQDRKLAARMALNYARASRMAALKIADGCLRDHFNAETTLLSDVFHSYLQFGKGQVLHVRGIQNFGCADNLTPSPYFLLAGTQATSSYLLTPRCRDGAIPHGTPEHFYQKPKCEASPIPPPLLWQDTNTEGDFSCFETVTRDIVRHFAIDGTADTEARLLPVLSMMRADAR